MQIKQNTQFHLKLKLAVLVAIFFFAGSILLSLNAGEKNVVYVPKAVHPAADTFSLSAIPALADEVNLYNEKNLITADLGSVQITHPNGKEEVTTQSAIDAGDKILVSDDGSAEILWFDGSVTRLSAGTDIRILQASYDANNINKTKISLWAKKGKIWAKVVNLIDGESKFLIESTSAIAGVRGTTFNYILEDSVPTVEVIENKVFLKKITNYTSEEILMDINSGQTGVIKKDGTMEIKAFDTEKLDEPYYSQNLEKDIQADKKLREVTLLKIRQFAQPLPGDPDYPKKQQLIQALLSETKDPVLLDQLEARVEKIKIYEAIAIADPEKVQETLNDVSDKIQNADLPKAEIQDYLNNNLKNIERAIRPVSEDKADINKTKNILHEGFQKQELPDEKINLRSASEEKMIPANPAEAPRLEVVEPEQTKKPEENIITVTPVKEVVQPARIYYPKKALLVPVVTPEEKHEQVLEKIEISRENWTERVEARIEKELEKEKIEESQSAKEGVTDEVSTPDTTKITETENIVNPVENAGTNDVPGGSTGITAPKSTTVTEPATPSEDSSISSDKDNKGVRGVPAEEKKEQKLQESPTTVEPGATTTKPATDNSTPDGSSTIQPIDGSQVAPTSYLPWSNGLIGQNSILIYFFSIH